MKIAEMKGIETQLCNSSIVQNLSHMVAVGNGVSDIGNDQQIFGIFVQVNSSVEHIVQNSFSHRGFIANVPEDVVYIILKGSFLCQLSESELFFGLFPHLANHFFPEIINILNYFEGKWGNNLF